MRNFPTSLLLSLVFFANFSFAGEGSGPFTAKNKWTSKSPFEHKLFIENKGQFDNKDQKKGSAIKYAVTNLGAQIYFTPSGLTYRYDEYESKTEEQREDALKKFAAKGIKAPENNVTHLTHMEWEGCNLNAEIIAEGMQAQYFTYPDVNDPTYKNWFKASAYQKIIYKELYPGIDVEYFFPEGKEGIKYNIILKPGADPSVIKMNIPENMLQNLRRMAT